MSRDILDAVYGCLIGGAIGDALGAPVEGLNYFMEGDRTANFHSMSGGLVEVLKAERLAAQERVASLDVLLRS